MTNRIIILGDSNTYGHGCSDRVFYYDPDSQRFVGKFFSYAVDPPSEYCWPSLLQKEFPEISVHNLSCPGRSNMGMFKDFCDFYKNNTPTASDLVIYAAAPGDRIEISKHDSETDTVSITPFFAPNADRNSWPDDDIQRLAKKQYFTHLHNKTVGQLNTASAILGCYGWTVANKIQFLFSIPHEFPMLVQTLTGIRQHQINHITRYDFSQAGDEEKNKLFISEDGYHPNNAGQQAYYAHEILPIIKNLP